MSGPNATLTAIRPHPGVRHNSISLLCFLVCVLLGVRRRGGSDGRVLSDSTIGVLNGKNVFVSGV